MVRRIILAIGIMGVVAALSFGWILTRHDRANPEAWKAAVQAIENRGITMESVAILWIVDFTKPSYSKRGEIHALKEGDLRLARVTHGSGSSKGSEPFASTFSNTIGSHQSSLGLYRIGEVLPSQTHGTKIMLHGLESGVNDRAAERAIVIHPPPAGANYLSIKAMLFHLVRDGWLGIGRSQGCPVLQPQDYAFLREQLDKHSGEALLYVYHR